MNKPMKSLSSATAKRVVFKINAPQAKSVYLAGDFNQWSNGSTTLRKGKNGEWSGQLMLKPGTYQYKYVVDSEWAVDPNSEIVENTFGSHNNLRIVK